MGVRVLNRQRLVNPRSVTEIQRRYIDRVIAAAPRRRAFIGAAARRDAEKELRAWGFSQDQIDYIIAQARDIGSLELSAGRESNRRRNLTGAAEGDRIAHGFGYEVEKHYASGTGYVGPRGYALFIGRNGDWESSVISHLGSEGSAQDLAEHLSAIHRTRNLVGRVAPIYEVFAGSEKVAEKSEAHDAERIFKAYVDLSKGMMPGAASVGRTIRLTKDERLVKEYVP